jgi:anaerobic magnesium-protoporphyrin IX monomethyl ester cyclase
MARVLVAHNYHLALDPHAVVDMRPYLPLGTVALATELRRAGHEVAVYDATFQRDPADFGLTLAGFSPDRVALVPDYHDVLQKMCLEAQRNAAITMIAAAARKGIAVLASGPDATDRPEVCLGAGAEVVVRGEPDAAVLAWASGSEIGPGEQRVPAPLVEPAPPRPDLDDLPPVDWDLIDTAPYAQAWRGAHGLWEVPVSAARGCPYRCNWCAKPIWGRTLSTRPAIDVVADARDLASRGADRIWFADDIFALNRRWLASFREAVTEVAGILPYRCQSRADLLLQPGYVEDLAATGCVEVWIGAESGAQHVLDAMTKDQSLDDIAEARGRLAANGIRAGFFLQLGYPGERWADVVATFDMVRRLRPDHIGVSVSYPLPGTPFHDRVAGQLSEHNWQGSMDNAVLFDGEYPQPFYSSARQVLRHEHALVQGVLAATRVARLRRRQHDLRRLAAAPAHAAQLPWHHLAVRWHARQGRS